MNHLKITSNATTIIEKYDTTDLLATLGGLNLSYNNQNKNYATSYYSTYILFNQNKNKPKASRKTLNALVEEMNKSGIIFSIQDPPEAPFFQKIIFDNDYAVFNGVDHHAAFFVSRLCEFVLLVNHSTFSSDFINLLKKIIKVSLILSDGIFKSISIDYGDIDNYHGDKPIYLPTNIESLKTALYIDKSDFFENGLSEEEIQRFFVFHHFPFLDIGKCLDKEIPYFYKRPFLDCGRKLLLIDPTAINTFLRLISIELSEIYDCKKPFLEFLNNVFFDWGKWCIRKCIMKYTNEDEELSNISCTNTLNYKDAIIQYSKSKVIVYSAYFINDVEGEHKKIVINQFLSLIKKQLNLLQSKYEVINIVLCYTYGASFNITESSIFKNSTLILPFDEFDSLVINEKSKPCVLFSAINFFQTTKGLFPPTMNAINRIAFLSSLDYDFYINEDADIYNSNIFVGFEYTYRYRFLSSKEETALIAMFHNEFVLLERDADDLYYLNTRFSDANLLVTYNKYPNGGTWLYSKKFDYNIVTFIGIISYWLTYLKDALKKNVNTNYYVEFELDDSDARIVKSVDNICLINIIPIWNQMNNKIKFDEINFIKNVLDAMGLLNPQVEQMLNKASQDPYMRYGSPLSSDNLMLIPFKKQLRPVFISKYYASLYDDFVGRDYAISERGLLPDCTIDDADLFLKGLVGKLFIELDKSVKKFNWLIAVKFIYEYQEDYLQKILINKSNLKIKYSLYEKHIAEINKIYFELNSVSPCIKFLLQYFSTMQYEGNQIIDECDFEVLVTLISRIIHYANIDDGIVFKLIPNELKLLKSKRIDADLTNLELFNKFLSKEMIGDSIDDAAFLTDHSSWPFYTELNEAYLDEHGFTFEEMASLVFALIKIGEEQDNEIKETTINNVLINCQEILDHKIARDEKKILKIVDHLSLSKREVFFDRSICNFRELYPWRYNRTESIARKPLIKYNDRIIWGNRSLYQCLLFTIEHIYEGKEPTKKCSNGKIKNLNGKILEYKGEQFNSKAFDYLSSLIPEIRFYKEIKSFNNHRMSNEKGEFLGDIDILGIDEKKHRIYLIEVKDYHYSKNMAEFGFELEEFLGNGKRKGFLEKELKRVEWVKEHIHDVKKEYNLNGDGWCVLYTFLSEKPLLCSTFGKATFNNISINEVNKKYFKNLK